MAGDVSSPCFKAGVSTSRLLMNQQGRFDKFTERARLCLSLAQEEAQRLQHGYIGTEHLLLGLIDTEDGAAIQVLRKLNVEPQQVRAAVEGIIGRGHDTVRSIIGLTPPAKRAIELAIDESQRLFHGNIGTEHLLLGLIREGDGIAGRVLTNMGITLERTRLAVRELEGYPQVAPRVTSSASSVTGTTRIRPNENPTPEQTRAMFTRAFAQQTLGQIREVVERFRLNAEITQQLLAEREASQGEAELSDVEQEMARTVPDTAAFGPSEVSQKTPEEMRATAQHLLTAQTPAQIRQIIQTTRQYIDMLEQMLNEEKASDEQHDGEDDGAV